MKRSVGIAMIGLGTHAVRGHLQPLQKMPGAKIISSYDPDKNKAKDLQIPSASSLEEVLALDDIDVVIDCSPERFRMDNIEAALSAGKHILADKPLLDKREDIPRLEQAFRQAEKAGLLLSSCHPRRFDRPYLWLRDQIPSFEKKNLVELLTVGSISFIAKFPSTKKICTTVF